MASGDHFHRVTYPTRAKKKKVALIPVLSFFNSTQAHIYNGPIRAAASVVRGRGEYDFRGVFFEVGIVDGEKTVPRCFPPSICFNPGWDVGLGRRAGKSGWVASVLLYLLLPACVYLSSCLPPSIISPPLIPQNKIDKCYGFLSNFKDVTGHPKYFKQLVRIAFFIILCLNMLPPLLNAARDR